jgi:hypothetical protein
VQDVTEENLEYKKIIGNSEALRGSFLAFTAKKAGRSMKAKKHRITRQLRCRGLYLLAPTGQGYRKPQPGAPYMANALCAVFLLYIHAVQCISKAP